MVNRIGSLALLNSTLRNVTDTQSKLGTLQEQISSGIKADTFAGLSGQVEQFTLLESKMRNAQQHIESNQVGLARLRTAQNAMDQMIDLADSMENLMVQARGATGEGLNFEQQMRNYIEQLANELNTNFEGRYLFGGTNTQNPPVADAFSILTVDGQPDNKYYGGSNDNLVYRADERIEYEFPVRADDPAFQKILAAAKSAITAYNQGADGRLSDAINLIQEAQHELIAAQSKVNSNIVNVEQISERLTALKLYWQGVTEQVGKTDLVAASTEVASHEALLQATFQIYARLSQLRLSDYLR